MSTSLKTTLAGIGAILAALGAAATGYADTGTIPWATLVPSLVAGVGLILAKDHNAK